MRASTAFRDGMRRVNSAPALLVGLVTVTFAVAVPLSLMLRAMLESHFGPSAAAESAAAPTSMDWWHEFQSQTSGLGTTFTASVIGFAAVLRNTSGLLDNTPLNSALFGVTVAWLLLISFLSGGIIDRYARQRPTRAHGFFAACGAHVWRFLRLGVVALMVYAWLFTVVHGWIFDGLYEELTRDLTSERTAFAIRLACYTLFAAMLAAVVLLFDFTRVRIVVEDRRSALGALVAGGRFVLGHRGQVLGLFFMNSLAYLALFAAYAALSPGAPRTDMHVWLVLGIGQAYIFGRHYLKLLVYSSETSLFQGMLAHAAYTAAPTPVWPDSPAVETVTNVEPTLSRR
jgi:hypothetical protein